MRLIAWLRALLRRPAWTPVRRSGLLVDPDFVRAMSRSGESIDPLNATLEE